MTKIDATTKYDQTVHFGENVIIHANVNLGEGVVVGHNVILHSHTTVGKNVVISDNAIVGKLSRPGPTSTVKTPTETAELIIGDDCLIGSGAIIFTGSTIGRATMVGDLAVLREQCQIGDYAMIGCNVVVENNVKIGSFTKIQTGAYITAYVTIEENVFIAPMVTTTNDNTMGRGPNRFEEKKGAHIRRGARIGGGSIILPRVTIGKETFVAAGSIVTKDIPDSQLVMGSPAKIIREVNKDEHLNS